MCLARISFRPFKRIRRTQLEELVADYLTFLYRNGQIVGEESNAAWQDGNYTIYVEVPRPDALDAKHNSTWVCERLHMVEQHLGAPPEWTILDDEVPRRFPSLQSSSFLFLHSGIYIDSLVPVHRGNDGKDIPLYLLPVDQYIRQEICDWSRHSQCYGYLELKSEALEIPAYRQMSDPKSQFSRCGRELCRKIETTTNIPTYYYMYRYWGRSQGEENRSCPLCGKQWRVKTKASKERKFWHFDFMCVHCRIVSHVPNNTDDERYAKIGEWRCRHKAGK